MQGQSPKKPRFSWGLYWMRIKGFVDQPFGVFAEEYYTFPYLFSTLFVTAAIILDLTIPILSDMPNLILLTAIVAAAWYGGLGPSLFAVFLAVMAEDYYFLDPKTQINLNTHDLPPLLAFTLVGLLVSSLVAKLNRNQKLLSKIALHDHLTGLPNRRLFDDRLETAMSISDRNEKKLAVAFVDLDNFKIINDTFGHRVGDEVLRTVGEILGANVREEDTVSRWGGDEFVLLFNDLINSKDADIIMGKIYDEFRKPFSVRTKEFKVSISAGLSIYPINGETRATLLHAADQALYQAKEKGKDCFVVAQPKPSFQI